VEADPGTPQIPSNTEKVDIEIAFCRIVPFRLLKKNQEHPLDQIFCSRTGQAAAEEIVEKRNSSFVVRGFDVEGHALSPDCRSFFRLQRHPPDLPRSVVSKGNCRQMG
jgi:hypothetical protein